MELNIVAVTIDQEHCDKKFSKVLSQNCYLFNDRVCLNPDNRIVLNPNYKDYSWYFGNNINVQAIVGTNGSGKSSLLELMYRIINNFSALVERGMKRNAAWKLLFVEGVYADLYYVQDGHLYCISCRGEYVVFLKDDCKVKMFSTNTGRYSDSEENKLLVKEMAVLAKELHYTIVTNYSLQSLISSDYADETSLAPDSSGVYAPEKEGSVWISHLYHKNDGYLTPIVLNPFRDQIGNIDMVTEQRLTVYRLSALLLFYRNRKGFFDDYELDDIRYKFSAQAVIDKYQKKNITENRIAEAIWNIDKFKRDHDDSVLSFILDRMGYGSIPLDDDISRAAASYLVYKILSIASKYPSYGEFDKWDVASFDKSIHEKDDKDSLDKLIKKIKRDRSHITVKVKQVCNAFEIIRIYGSQRLINEFGIDDYRKLIQKPEKKRSSELMEIMYSLPPSFFVPTLTIKNPDGVLPIEISKFSSGERQLLYTFSTYAYHIRNLLSISKDRVAYRHISLILDEAEICFHPEYQRMFLYRLLKLIKNLHLNYFCAFNIIIATHSPFILSDIPRNNILYLDKGASQPQEKYVKPLAANVSDILFQSFFLKNGFIGEWARIRINKLLERNRSWDTLTRGERDFVDGIGDEYLKKQIKRRLNYPSDL